MKSGIAAAFNGCGSPAKDLTIRDRVDENQQSLSDNTTANEPPPIRQLSAPDLKALIESGTPFELADVRTDEERATARIEGSRLLDQAYHDALLRLDRNTPIVFQCHLGVRSQQAAEYFRREGFRNLHNLRGGIDAWSLLVDASVPRY
jgi:monothiol glutaredoxin